MFGQLSEYVTSFGSQTRRSIYSVLSQSYDEKNEIGRLIGKLQTFSSPVNYVPRFFRELEPVQKEVFIDMFRDIDLRIRTQFDISNSLSLLESAMDNIFSGELEKIQKDIDYLNGYIDSYAFISGEDDLFNDYHIENFDNELNSVANENYPYTIPDRDGSPFYSGNYAKVDPISGKLIFSESSVQQDLVALSSNEIESVSYDTNFATNYISTDSGIEKLFNSVISKSWNLTIKTPFVLRESLLDQEQYIDFKNNVISQPRSASCNKSCI
jgi:hypothetical protein